MPFVGGGDYTDWVFEPGTVGDSEHLLVSYGDYTTVVANEPEFDDDYYATSLESVEDSFPLEGAGLDVEDVGTYLYITDLDGVLGGHVAAEYSRNAVASALEDDGYGDETDQEGFTVYLGPEGSQAVGIDGSDIVYGAAGPGTDATPVEIVAALIDAENGTEDRYVDGEGFGTLTEQFGSSTFTYGSTQIQPEETDAENGRFEGAVASGVAAAINGSTTEVRVVVVFETEADVDMGDIREYADSEQFERLNDVSSSRNGTAAVITGQVDTDELDETFDWRLGLA